METLSLNSVGKVKRVKEGGREYLVAPMVLICPGVLNGSRGALYYPPEEIARSQHIWNNTPIVVYHPTRNGQNVSARTPGVIEQSGIGTLRNSRISKKRLVADGWFDAEKTRKVDPRVYNALVNGERMELSTGLFTVNDPAPTGSVCPVGRPYTHIARDYRADHLAVLPDQKGACSLQDGCGVLVNKAADAWQEIQNAFDPNQPRDDFGRWKSAGSASSTGSGNGPADQRTQVQKEATAAADSLHFQLYDDLEKTLTSSGRFNELNRAVLGLYRDLERSTEHADPRTRHKHGAYHARYAVQVLTTSIGKFKRHIEYLEKNDPGLAGGARRVLPLLDKALQTAREAAAVLHDAHLEYTTNTFDGGNCGTGKGGFQPGNTCAGGGTPIHSAATRTGTGFKHEEPGHQRAAWRGVRSGHVARRPTSDEFSGSQFRSRGEEYEASQGAEGPTREAVDLTRQWLATWKGSLMQDPRNDLEHLTGVAEDYSHKAALYSREARKGDFSEDDLKASAGYHQLAAQTHNRAAMLIQREFLKRKLPEGVSSSVLKTVMDYHRFAGALHRDAGLMLTGNAAGQAASPDRLRWVQVGNAYDPSQPRADDGKWTDSGSGSGGSASQQTSHSGPKRDLGQQLSSVAGKASMTAGLGTVVGTGLYAAGSALSSAATAVALPAGSYAASAGAGAGVTAAGATGVGLLAAPLIVGLATKGKYGGAIDEDTYQEFSDVMHGIFSHMTLGTGPLAVKAVAAGARHSPRLFRLLVQGMKEAGAGVKAGYQSVTGNSDNCGTGAGGFQPGNTCAGRGGYRHEVPGHQGAAWQGKDRSGHLARRYAGDTSGRSGQTNYELYLEEVTGARAASEEARAATDQVLKPFFSGTVKRKGKFLGAVTPRELADYATEPFSGPEWARGVVDEVVHGTILADTYLHKATELLRRGDLERPVPGSNLTTRDSVVSYLNAADVRHSYIIQSLRTKVFDPVREQADKAIKIHEEARALLNDAAWTLANSGGYRGVQNAAPPAPPAPPPDGHNVPVQSARASSPAQVQGQLEEQGYQASEAQLPPSLKLLLRILRSNPAAIPQLIQACKAALAVVDGKGERQDMAPVTANEYAQSLVLNLLDTSEYPLLTNAELGDAAQFDSDEQRLYAFAGMARFAAEHTAITANSFDTSEERRAFFLLLDVAEGLAPLANARRVYDDRDEYDDYPRGRGRSTGRDREGNRSRSGGRHFFETCDRNDKGWCEPGQRIGQEIDRALASTVQDRIRQQVQARIGDKVGERLASHIDTAIEAELEKRLPVQRKKPSAIVAKLKQFGKTAFGAVPGAYAGAKGAALAAPFVAKGAALLAGTGLPGAALTGGTAATLPFAAPLAGALAGGVGGYYAAGYLGKKAGEILARGARKAPRAVGALAGYMGKAGLGATKFGLKQAFTPTGLGAITGGLAAGATAATVGAPFAVPAAIGAGLGAVGGKLLGVKARRNRLEAGSPSVAGSPRVAASDAARREIREAAVRARQQEAAQPKPLPAGTGAVWEPITPAPAPPKTAIRQPKTGFGGEPAFAHEPAGSHMKQLARVESPPPRKNTNYTKTPQLDFGKDIPAFLPEVPDKPYTEELAAATKRAVDATLAVKTEGKKARGRRRDYTRLLTEATIAHEQAAEAATAAGFDEIAEGHIKSAMEMKAKASRRKKPTTNTEHALVTNTQDEHYLGLIINALQDPRERAGFAETLAELDQLLVNFYQERNRDEAGQFSTHRPKTGFGKKLSKFAKYHHARAGSQDAEDRMAGQRESLGLNSELTLEDILTENRRGRGGKGGRAGRQNRDSIVRFSSSGDAPHAGSPLDRSSMQGESHVPYSDTPDEDEYEETNNLRWVPIENWDESDHPRDSAGRFTKGGTGTSGTARSGKDIQIGAAKTATKHAYKHETAGAHDAAAKEWGKAGVKKRGILDRIGMGIERGIRAVDSAIPDILGPKGGYERAERNLLRLADRAEAAGDMEQGHFYRAYAAEQRDQARAGGSLADRAGRAIAGVFSPGKGKAAPTGKPKKTYGGHGHENPPPVAEAPAEGSSGDDNREKRSLLGAGAVLGGAAMGGALGGPLGMGFGALAGAGATIGTLAAGSAIDWTRKRAKQRSSSTLNWQPVTNNSRQQLVTNCGGDRSCGCNTDNAQPSERLDMTSEKACQIVKDDQVHGKKLTRKQRGLFGARCGQGR